MAVDDRGRPDVLLAMHYDAILWHELRLTAQYTAATASYKRYRNREPEHACPHVLLILSYSQIGHLAVAQATIADAMKHSPTFSLKRWAQAFLYKERADLARELEVLRRAGLQ